MIARYVPAATAAVGRGTEKAREKIKKKEKKNKIITLIRVRRTRATAAAIKTHGPRSRAGRCRATGKIEIRGETHLRDVCTGPSRANEMPYNNATRARSRTGVSGSSVVVVFIIIILFIFFFHSGWFFITIVIVLFSARNSAARTTL